MCVNLLQPRGHRIAHPFETARELCAAGNAKRVPEAGHPVRVRRCRAVQAPVVDRVVQQPLRSREIRHRCEHHVHLHIPLRRHLRLLLLLLLTRLRLLRQVALREHDVHVVGSWVRRPRRFLLLLRAKRREVAHTSSACRLRGRGRRHLRVLRAARSQRARGRRRRRRVFALALAGCVVVRLVRAPLIRRRRHRCCCRLLLLLLMMPRAQHVVGGVDAVVGGTERLDELVGGRGCGELVAHERAQPAELREIHTLPRRLRLRERLRECE